MMKEGWERGENEAERRRRKTKRRRREQFKDRKATKMKD